MWVNIYGLSLVGIKIIAFPASQMFTHILSISWFSTSVSQASWILAHYTWQNCQNWSAFNTACPTEATWTEHMLFRVILFKYCVEQHNRCHHCCVKPAALHLQTYIFVPGAGHLFPGCCRQPSVPPGALWEAQQILPDRPAVGTEQLSKAACLIKR